MPSKLKKTFNLYFFMKQIFLIINYMYSLMFTFYLIIFNWFSVSNHIFGGMHSPGLWFLLSNIWYTFDICKFDVMILIKFILFNIYIISGGLGGHSGFWGIFRTGNSQCTDWITSKWQKGMFNLHFKTFYTFKII